MKAKVDNNQSDIVKKLRSIPGLTVELGHDDFLCGYRGKTFWYELKSEDAVSRKTKKVLESAIKPSQKKIRSEFTGHYKIVSNLTEILKDLGIIH